MSKVEKTAWRRGRESLDALHDHAEDAGDEGELRQSRSLCRLFEFQNRALWRCRQPHAVADGSTNSLIFDVSCSLALPQVRSNCSTEKESSLMKFIYESIMLYVPAEVQGSGLVVTQAKPLCQSICTITPQCLATSRIVILLSNSAPKCRCPEFCVPTLLPAQRDAPPLSHAKHDQASSIRAADPASCDT
jgi:hypothetical protein